jgi:hypothetical protein
MFKLDNLIVSGLEVYSLPEAPRPRPVTDGDARERPDGAGGRSLLRALLVHTFAVGGLPLPGSGRRS